MLRFGVVGLGQCGSRMALAVQEQLDKHPSMKLPVLYINSSEVDFRGMPGGFYFEDKEGIKLMIGGGEGSGRRPNVGESFAVKNHNKIKSFFAHHFRDMKGEVVFVMVGAAGGTGGGTLFNVIDTLSAIGMRPGVVMALPQLSEGIPAVPNALKALSRLQESYINAGRVSPVILVDNEYAVKKYGIKAKFWESVNNAIATSIVKFALAIGDKSSMDTVGSLDELEIKRFLTFGRGFCDVLSVVIEPASVEGLMTLDQKIDESRKFVECYNLNTAKAVVMSIDVPTTLDDVMQKQVAELIGKLSAKFSGCLQLRGVFGNSSLTDSLEVHLFISGLDLPSNIAQLVSRSVTNLRGYHAKFGKGKQVDLSRLNLESMDDDFAPDRKGVK